MKKAKFRRIGSTPQKLGASSRCDLARQGKNFKCSDLSLPPAECCSHCRSVSDTIK